MSGCLIHLHKLSTAQRLVTFDRGARLVLEVNVYIRQLHHL